MEDIPFLMLMMSWLVLRCQLAKFDLKFIFIHLKLILLILKFD